MLRHYEKIITLCCFLVLFVNVGFPSSSFGVYQPYIVQIVGDSAASMVLATRTLVSLAAILFVDRFFQALNCRFGVALATCLTAAGFAIYSIADSLPLFIVGAISCGAGYGLGGMVGMTMLTRRWYPQSQIGSAVGFATVGSGMAFFIVPSIAVRIIEGISLHTSFLLESLTALTVALIALVFIRNHPKTDPDEKATESAEALRKIKTGSSTPRPQSQPSLIQSVGAHISEGNYRLLILAMVLVGMISVGGPAYVTVFFTDSGIDSVLAATLLSIQGLFLALSKFGTGKLFDIIGTRKGSAIMFVVEITGLAAMCLSTTGNAVIATIAVVLYGAGVALGSVGVSVWSLELASPKNKIRSIKNYQVAYSVGGFLASSFPGFLKEATGTYLSTYAILMLGACIACTIIVGTYTRKRRYVATR